MTVIGIDPSLSSTGIAIDGRHAFTVHTDTNDPNRLAVIYDTVHQTVTTPGVTLAVIEDLPTHAKGAGLTGMAQGVIRLALIRARVPWTKVTAATLKKYATGAGNASKADMRMAWYQRAGVDVRDDNQVDALWLREIGLALTSHPDKIPLPKTHLVALDKVTLP